MGESWEMLEASWSEGVGQTLGTLEGPGGATWGTLEEPEGATWETLEGPEGATWQSRWELGVEEPPHSDRFLAIIRSLR